MRERETSHEQSYIGHPDVTKLNLTTLNAQINAYMRRKGLMNDGFRSSIKAAFEESTAKKQRKVA